VFNIIQVLYYPYVLSAQVQFWSQWPPILPFFSGNCWKTISFKSLSSHFSNTVFATKDCKINEGSRKLTRLNTLIKQYLAHFKGGNNIWRNFRLR